MMRSVLSSVFLGYSYFLALTAFLLKFCAMVVVIKTPARKGTASMAQHTVFNTDM